MLYKETCFQTKYKNMFYKETCFLYFPSAQILQFVKYFYLLQRYVFYNGFSNVRSSLWWESTVLFYKLKNQRAVYV